MAPGEPSRPSGGNVPGAPASQQVAGSSSAVGKKKKHRGGKKRRNRRQSFAASADMGHDDDTEGRPSLADIAGHGNSRGSTSFYGLSRNLSNTSLESEALLDHRDHQPARVRRQSVTVVAGALQNAGLIGYRRGVITVLDRPRLEDAACECYASMKGYYRRVVF